MNFKNAVSGEYRNHVSSVVTLRNVFRALEAWHSKPDVAVPLRIKQYHIIAVTCMASDTSYKFDMTTRRSAVTLWDNLTFQRKRLE
jgi:hypothetical protein